MRRPRSRNGRRGPGRRRVPMWEGPAIRADNARLIGRRGRVRLPIGRSCQRVRQSISRLLIGGLGFRSPGFWRGGVGGGREDRLDFVLFTQPLDCLVKQLFGRLDVVFVGYRPGGMTEKPASATGIFGAFSSLEGEVWRSDFICLGFLILSLRQSRLYMQWMLSILTTSPSFLHFFDSKRLPIFIQQNPLTSLQSEFLQEAKGLIPQFVRHDGHILMSLGLGALAGDSALRQSTCSGFSSAMSTCVKPQFAMRSK